MDTSSDNHINTASVARSWHHALEERQKRLQEQKHNCDLDIELAKKLPGVRQRNSHRFTRSLMMSAQSWTKSRVN
jgi:hypothetical protein